jgi:hypothetical protein
MLLIQYTDERGRTAVGRLIDEARRVLPLVDAGSVHELALQAIGQGVDLSVLVEAARTGEACDYEPLVREGRLLPPLTHPDPAHCFVTGTGLTHLGSAASRDAMHRKLADTESLTDSMKMFKLGLEGGKPQPGREGVAPEWFYKGDGSIVRTSGQTLESPHFALDGGDEVEIVGLYVNGPDGTPWRVGHALGNEFSDHVTEQQNYLYLAHSKLRACSVGPALRLGPLPAHVEGRAALRDAAGAVRWEQPFLSGEANMCHSLANLEHHHFKYALFRRPGDVHLHFFGAATLSFSSGLRVAEGDTCEISSPEFGPPLVNRVVMREVPLPPVRAL